MTLLRRGRDLRSLVLREQDELMFDLLSKHRRLRLFEQAVRREPLLENLSPRLVTHWFESRTLGEPSSSASTSSSSGGSSPLENADTSSQWQQAHHNSHQHLGSNLRYPHHSLPTTTVHYDSGVPVPWDRYSPTSAPSGLDPHRQPMQTKHPSHVMDPPVALKYSTDEMAIAQRVNWLLQLQQQDQALNAAANRQREQLEMRRRFELDQTRVLEQDFLSHGLNLRVHRVRIREWLRLNQPQCGEPLEVKLVPTAGGTIITTTVYNNDRYAMHLPLRSLVALSLGSDSITLQTCERPSFYVTRRATGQSQTSADFTTERSASIESQHVFGVVPSELIVVRAQLEQLACSLPLLRVLLFPKPISSVYQTQPQIGAARAGALAWAPSMASPHLATSKSSPALLGAAAGYAQQPVQGIDSMSSPGASARPAHQRSLSWTNRAAYEDDCDRAAAMDLTRLQAGARSIDPCLEHAGAELTNQALPLSFGTTSTLDVSHSCPVPLPTTPENPNNKLDDMEVASSLSISTPRSRESTQGSDPTWDMFASPWSSIAAPTQTISSRASPSPASQIINGQREATPRPSNATLGVIGDPISRPPSGGAGSKHSDANSPSFMWNPFEATHCFNIQDWNSHLGTDANQGSTTISAEGNGTEASSTSLEKSDPNVHSENANLLDYDPNTLHLFTTPAHSDLQLNFGLETSSSWPW
ncbi:BQ5605_C009g05645 [Microbotryum silenes-dioicae]|uniref:BQ5605_C009g05645 protein n=1 Tax=Microbotryum silenes-dioicae TaxID=796604 RepID=A0A2X0P966_9BASI|nr:BQ5605_C009g05645 [Microbotryum silenes-dioicae]